jgi:integrase
MTPPYGDGSIFWNAKRQRWVGIFTADVDENGKRIRRSVSAKNKTEARKKLRLLQREALDGRPTPDGSMRLGALLDKWMTESVAPRSESPNTLAGYRWAVDRHLKPGLGSKRLRDLTPEDVDAFLRHKKDSGLSHSSVSRLRSALVSALRYGERYGFVGRNVAQLVDLPRAPQRDGRSMTEQQARDLLDAAKGERLEATITCGIMLGLRPGELLGLCWSDVDLDLGRLMVRRSLKRENNQLRLGKPKTPSSVRTLDMPIAVGDALRAHKTRQARERLAAGPLWVDMDLVFATELGTPFDPSNFRRDFSRMTARAGIGHWHPHEMRHSAASLLSHSGVSIEGVADVLGHANIRTTSAIYRHQVTESVNGAAAPMDRLFGISKLS